MAEYPEACVVLDYTLLDCSVEQLLVWVDIGVAAAEQLFESSQGQEKKQYVLDFLARQGYDLDSAQVANAVEAAVLKLHASLEGAA